MKSSSLIGRLFGHSRASHHEIRCCGSRCLPVHPNPGFMLWMVFLCRAIIIVGISYPYDKKNYQYLRKNYPYDKKGHRL